MIKLSKPYIPEIAIENVATVLRSGNLVQGEFVLRLEEELKSYLGVKHVVVVSSGTAALHLALIALGIGPGDEVIVPAFTFPATINVVELTGATPVLVDIGLYDFCIETSKLEAAITSKTKAIMPVHEFGQSAEMEEILRVSKKYQIPVIEDAACALGTEYKGEKIGALGLMGCFSFHPRKAITTGEGGAISTNDDELAAKIRSLRNHGIEVIDGLVQFNYAGLNYRMTDFQAALGYFQFLEIESLLEQRLTLAQWYDEQLSDCTDLHLPTRFQERKHVYQSYHVLINLSHNRNDVKSTLFSNGIETNYGANAISWLNYYNSKYKFKQSGFINSRYAYDHGLALPMSHTMTQQEVLIVCDNLKQALVNGR